MDGFFDKIPLHCNSRRFIRRCFQPQNSHQIGLVIPPPQTSHEICESFAFFCDEGRESLRADDGA